MKKAVFILLFLSAAGSVAAQGIGDVLAAVERNNKELQAMRKDIEAAEAGIKAANNLEDPSIEYSPFFRKGVGGVASSELIVSQGFDFPTLYTARSKSGKLQLKTLDMQYSSARRDVLLQAKNLCLDLIYQNQLKSLLEQRQKNASELLRLFAKKLDNGEATQLEVNKIKMDLMNIHTETAASEAARAAALQSLRALNGDTPVEFASARYEQRDPSGSTADILAGVLASDYDILTARASEEASAQEVKVNRQNWIPKLQVGYRRNTDIDEASNGFIVGASIPLFSGRNKMKMAKAQHAGAQLRLENARISVENRVRAQITQMQELKKSRDAYDVKLMHQTLALLYDAVEGGELSVLDFYVEADAIYKNLQTYMDIERNYQGVLADIYKNDL